MFGTMTHAAILLGTSLRLEAGQRVRLVEATNLPQGGYFASPATDEWANGDSIHITAEDVTFES